MGTKKFVILHSNDMHGDFYAEMQGAEGSLIGGLALLSGYVHQVRQEEENVLYVIAGDMLQGSLIDTEFRGVSTVEIMNWLTPDVVTLGNHELDYGLAHLLFLEKMARFPVVNANLYIKKYHNRLMRPCLTLNVAGFRILFIGIITEDTLAKLQSDEIGTFVDVEDAVPAVGRICNAYRHQDIDLTVLLTHIGFEQDKKLASLLDPNWGVDMIIGGHSHTLLEQPAVVNDILIAQANVGTDQIGRFDLVVDGETNAIQEWTWRLIPICNDLAEPDAELQAFIDSFGAEIDRKYHTIVCRFARCLTHPRRDEETALANLVTDILAERAQVDVALVGGGSIRRQKLGPVVTLGDLRETLPFDDGLLRLTITGAQLRQIFSRSMCPENRRAYESVFQVSGKARAVYDDAQERLESLTIDRQPVKDDGRYTIGLMEFHYGISDKAFGLSHEEMAALGEPQVVCTSCLDVLEEYLSAHQHLTKQVEGRLVFRETA
jgi:5'-nucleotidase/UDP-sugar diphosphatase